MPRLFKNRRGQALVYVVVISSVLLMGVVTVLNYTSVSIKSSVNTAAKTVALAEDLLALDIFSEMVNIRGNPEASVEFYPIPAEFNNSNFRPFLTPFRTMTSGSYVPNLLVEGTRVGGRCQEKPPEPRVGGTENYNDCLVTHLTSSDTKLSSFETGPDLTGWSADYRSRNQTEVQKGFIAFNSIDRLSPALRSDLFSKANFTGWNGALNFKLIKIEQLIGDEKEPQLWAGLKVTAGSTRAIVKVPAPPEPSCQLKATPAPRLQSCVTQTSYSYSTQTTQTPRDSITIARCTPNYGADHMPLYPYVDGCPSNMTSLGANTFYSSTPQIWRIYLEPWGQFSNRGRIYATNPGGEVLSTAERQGMSQISFAQLLSEMGVSATISSQQSISTPVYSQVCTTVETAQCSGDCIELGGARGATINLYANSILGAPGKVSGDGFSTYQLVQVGRQRVADIGKYNLDQAPLGSVVVTPPSNLYQLQGPKIWKDAQGNLDDRWGMWTPQASVQGVLKASPIQNCEIPLKVYPPPPPACIASAAKTQLSPGESTTITLNCQGPTSGKVTSAQIVGGNVFPSTTFQDSYRLSSNYKIASTTVTRNSSIGPQKVEILVSGPGGQVSVSTYLGAICKFNNPTEIYSNWGRLFRRADYYYTSNGTLYHTYDWPYPTPQGDFGVVKTCPANSFCMYNFEKGDQWHHQIWVAIGVKSDPLCRVLDYAIRTVGCFAAETKIRMGDGGDKEVTKIQENDLVYNPLFKKPVRVLKVYKGPEKKPLYSVRLGSDHLTVTEDHPFLTQRGWVQAEKLRPQDLIMGEFTPRVVTSVEKLPYDRPKDVYNFELDTEISEGHLVLANGVPTGDIFVQRNLKKQKEPLP